MADPILRWAGSKKRLLPILSAAIPNFDNRYVEPFVGSAVLFLQLPSCASILGDLNKDLIQTYEVIRQFPKAIWKRLTSYPTDSEFYYSLRSIDPNSLNKYDRASRFVYLNRFCFNGVYRTNLAGQFNVARGEGKLHIPTFETFKNFADHIKQAMLVNGDFENIVNSTAQGDFIYLDPPYAELGKRDRGEYGPGSFKLQDLVRLTNAIKRADARGVKILLSYTPSEILQQELHGWQFREVSVQRNVAGFTSKRKKVKEILISNYSWHIRA
jgi:DNA adenine methylase